MRASRGELLLARFWAKVKVGDGCWEWVANRNPAGYGLLKVEGRMMSAHRLSWELLRGRIPDGIQVLHHCDNPSCIRPDHLFLGTQSDNLNDMVRKGRGLTAEQQAAIRHPKGDDHWQRKHPELVKRGTNHHAAKLDDDKVRAIRKAHAEGRTDLQLAREYGVSEGTIHFIVKGQTWKHVR